jgi:hypothetical protein
VAKAGRDSSEYSRAIQGVLVDLARNLCTTLGGNGCVISRVVGDLLVDLVEYTPEGRRFQLGHGYLISDYPLTREVLEQREPRAVAIADPDAEPNEVKLLIELGFASLLMLPLVLGDDLWALVEVYGKGADAFGATAVEAAEPLLAAAADALLSTR